MERVDPNYLEDQKYIPYKELSKQEKEKMKIRYLQLLPFYERRGEIIDVRGFCPMDILHEVILSDSKKKAVSIERTMKTKAIREAKNQQEYIKTVPTQEELKDFDVLEYIQIHENELSQIFNVKI